MRPSCSEEKKEENDDNEEELSLTLTLAWQQQWSVAVTSPALESSGEEKKE